MKTKSFLFTILAIFTMVIVACSVDQKERFLPIEGLNGSNTLVGVLELGPGENGCAAGGVQLKFGLDLDGDGILSESEVTSIANVCHGLDGQDGEDGTSALIDVQPVDAGPNSLCLEGGVIVYTGYDLNSNNILDENERAHSEVVCSGTTGASGANSLIRTEEISPTPDGCANGGFRLYSGIDKNFDGILDDNEVEKSQDVCNGEDGIFVVFKTVYDEETSCDNGGVKWYYGLDQNSNGVLDDTERADFIEVCNGVDGEDGADGFNSLQKTKAITASTAHPNGGYQLMSGLDINRNGSLEDGEVTSVISVFNGNNGATGQNGYSSLTSTEFIPVSPAHPYGGYMLYMGIDVNRNGQLDINERTSSTFISNGINGTNGTDGSNGTNGSNGSNGYNTLVEILPDVPNAGDKTVQVGLDVNRNGILDPSEISDSFVVSNGTNGHNSLTRTAPVAPTTAHPNGGYNYMSGLDLNDNGYLDNSEVTSLVFVSNGRDGEDGHNSVTRTVSVPPTATYPNGGYRLMSGIDLNDNNYLDDSEVISVVFVSNGVDGAAGYTALVEVLENNPATGQNTIKIGLDINRNGVLDASEVTETFIVTDGVNGQNGSNGYISLINVLSGNPTVGHTTIQVGLDTNRNGVLDASEVLNTFVVSNGNDGADGTCEECICTEISVEIEEPGPDNCQFGGLKITILKNNVEEVHYVCNGGGCFTIADGEFVIDFQDGDGPNNKPQQVNTYMPKHLYPRDGCEGYIITGAYYTGCNSEKNGKIRDGGAGNQNVLELYNNAGGMLFFDFSKYNSISNGNGTMGKVNVMSFDLNQMSGSSFLVEAIDMDGKHLSKTVSVSSAFETVEIGWSNVVALYISGNAKFQIDNLRLACGNIINTCD